MRRLITTVAFLSTVLGPIGAMADDTASFAWQTKPGAEVPLDTILRDESGREVALRRLIANAPVILDLGYFRCPSLCGVVRSDLLNALHGSGLSEGRDYGLVVLSIDPAETSSDAARAKAADLAQSPLSTGADWHYVTGTQQALDAIASAIGFHDRYDPAYRQFLHPTGLAVLTPAGTVSGYLLGVGYSPGDLRAAVIRARNGGIARAILPVLLLCFHFDETTGRYTIAIMKILRLMGVGTLVTLGGMMVVLHRRRPRR